LSFLSGARQTRIEHAIHIWIFKVIADHRLLIIELQPLTAINDIFERLKGDVLLRVFRKGAGRIDPGQHRTRDEERRAA
jgi:REP element-mobilizing transposase RayT